MEKGEHPMYRILLPFLIAAAALILVQPVGAAPRTVLKVDGEEGVILRDGYGVPHVFAPSERAVFFGNGYAAAQDRMAQMEKYRRAARGEMAEMVGPSALRSDQETRREGYTDAEREESLRGLEPAVRASLEAYADGVNAFLKDRANDMPPEVRKLGVPIRPWRAID